MLDQDVSARASTAFPALYLQGQANSYFSWSKISAWMVRPRSPPPFFQDIDGGRPVCIPRCLSRKTRAPTLNHPSRSTRFLGEWRRGLAERSPGELFPHLT